MTTDPRPAPPEPAMQDYARRPNEEFEGIGELYYARFHRLRPGKDEPMGSGCSGMDDDNVRQFSDWIKYQALTDAIFRIIELEQETERLQRALAFWLPGVPAGDPQIAQRAGDDAHLLAGCPVSGEPDAEGLGWISLREAP